MAIDAGTTGVRTVACDLSGRIQAIHYREIARHFPQPGWVEQEAEEIRDLVFATLQDMSDECLEKGYRVASVGLTNQRETVVCWDRDTGKPLHRAIVWQDRRTAGMCNQMREAGMGVLVRDATGLVIDPYFSATKIKWLLDNAIDDPPPGMMFGTVDSFLAWNLTGGVSTGVSVTDPSNACRTMLFDIHKLEWSEQICDAMGIDIKLLPIVVPSCGEIGAISRDVPGDCLHGTRLAGILGDQQSALFGQACLCAGMAKVTYGTGSFVLVNTGHEVVAPPDGLVASIAWDLGSHSTGDARVSYTLEGSIFSTGATIQWLRDGLGIIRESSEIGPLAASATGSNGLYIVPAFSGLGSPWWDPHARACIVGISEGVGRKELARATLESIAFQVRDCMDKIARTMADQSGIILKELRVDGGVSVVDDLLQMQADQLGMPVTRPRNVETTAVGVALMAALGAGVFISLDDMIGAWQMDVTMQPEQDRSATDVAYQGWIRALEKSRGWMVPAGSNMA
ncbi:MAG: glycerol kinase GlpK [Actinobacteria bacterium]|nr:glycerol kinase GlpK [Actinomycetota bacterium]